MGFLLGVVVGAVGGVGVSVFYPVVPFTAATVLDYVINLFVKEK